MENQNELTYFYTEYSELTDTKKAEFSRVANKILAVNYLTNAKEKDRKDYYFIIMYLRLFKAYFSILDYEVAHHEYDGVISVRNMQKYNHFQFKKLESIMLLLLRKIYSQKMQELSLHKQITATMEEVLGELDAIGVLERGINKTEIKEMFQLFKRYNICELEGNLDEETVIIILYPTILYIVAIEEIDAIDKELKKYERGGEVVDEEVDAN